MTKCLLATALVVSFLLFTLLACSFIWSFYAPPMLIREGRRHYALAMYRGSIQFGMMRRVTIVGVTPSGFATGDEIGYRDQPSFIIRRLWWGPWIVITSRRSQWPPVVSVTGDVPSLLSDVPSTNAINVIAIAHWPLLLLTALPPAWWLLIHRRRAIARQRRAAGLCPRCGYDLRASVDRCPECGSANRLD